MITFSKAFVARVAFGAVALAGVVAAVPASAHDFGDGYRGWGGEHAWARPVYERPVYARPVYGAYAQPVYGYNGGWGRGYYRGYDHVGYRGFDRGVIVRDYGRHW